MKPMNRPFGGLHTTMRSAGARSGASWKRTCTRKKSLSTSGNQWFREVRVQVGAVSLTQAYARIYATRMAHEPTVGRHAPTCTITSRKPHFLSGG